MGIVFALSKNQEHKFSKIPSTSLMLIAGEGIEGDAHRGTTVKHRSRVKADPTQANLRQVHLIHNELIIELQNKGFNVKPATMGENITTVGIDLLSLPTHTVLKIGNDVTLKITGLRNPCAQLDQYQSGLTKAVLDYDSNKQLIRKAGIMAVVVKGGKIQPFDNIEVIMPDLPYLLLNVV